MLCDCFRATQPCQVLAIWITVTLLPDQRKPCPEALMCSSTALAHEHTHTGPTVHDRWMLAICRVSSLPTDRWPGDVSALKTRMSRELWESFLKTLFGLTDSCHGYMLNQCVYKGQRGFVSAWRGTKHVEVWDVILLQKKI